MANKEIQLYKSGVHNLLDEEIIPTDGASDSNNWYTQDGKIKLIPGKLLIGEAGLVGSVTGEIFGYKTNGTKVHWRKIGTKIQYLNGTTWTDVVTGLTSSADYSFTNYSSLAGTFTFAIGVDGIYKMHNAVPGSFNTMYNSAKNFKGLAFIDKGRMILWNRPEDKTGLYGSYIDRQDSTVYTTVAGEATTSLTGTLAFKAGGATRNCFGVTITLTGTGEVYTDNYLGILTGSLGGTGTINYMTGAYTLSNAGVGTAGYRWEDSNVHSVTDFTHTATRLAGEGFQFPQDEGGDPILNVVIGSDGYYSMKKQSAYRLSIDADDTNATNEVFRKELGLQSYHGAVSTGNGIIFMNTANQEKPEMTILQKNLTGDAVEPVILFPQFKFANYLYDDCTIDTYERYILVACKTPNATSNDTILLCDLTNKTVDITSYTARTFARNGGDLFMGSSVSQSVYQLFSGFDDDGFSISNFWTGKGELWGTSKLKKYSKIRLKGSISASQSYEVYVNYDDSGNQLVGTVLGTGSYVDYSSPQTIGANIIGTAQIGGDVTTDIFPYFVEIRLKKVPKFRKRKMTFVALGIGYVDIDSQLDYKIELYQDKIPTRFRQKQNVSLNGITTNLDNPQF
jgi:hypothetical protein